MYIKKGIIYGLLTIILLALIFKFGITAAIKISELIQGRNPVIQGDITQNILPSPNLYPLPIATNSGELVVNGLSTANQKVNLYINDILKEIDVDSEGKFTSNINLTLGVNQIYAVAKNNEGLLSSPSSISSVFYSSSPPQLEISEPQDNSLIKKNKKITIKGKTDKTSKIYINEHNVIVENDGSFSYIFDLNEGDNIIKVIAQDPANNQAEKNLTLHFQP